MSKLQLAFHLMRREGLYVRSKAPCCTSCSIARIASDLEKKPDEKLAAIKGVVYCHSQDRSDYRRGHNLHIRYGPSEVRGRQVGQHAAEVAALIVKCLKEARVEHVWSGRSCETIEVVGKRVDRAGKCKRSKA